VRRRVITALRVDPPGRSDALVPVESLAIEGVSAEVGSQQAQLRSVSLPPGQLSAKGTAHAGSASVETELLLEKLALACGPSSQLQRRGPRRQ
jgi:hypothetical protein